MDSLIRKEIFVALVINLLIGAIMTLFTLPKVDTLILIGGPDSGGFGLIASGFIIPLISVPIITTLLQNKLKNGKIVIPLCQTDRVSRLLPANLILRTLAFSAIMSFFIAPLFLLLNQALIGSYWTYQQAFILNIIFLILLTIVLIPYVIRSAVHNFH